MSDFIYRNFRWFLAGYLLLINLLTFILYGVDKHRARMRQWRIPEASLLLFAVFGGSIGGFFGMKLFHHKTKHPKFYIGIPVIFVFQVITAVCFWIL